MIGEGFYYYAEDEKPAVSFSNCQGQLRFILPVLTFLMCRGAPADWSSVGGEGFYYYA
jgi:hypothetical protein